MPQWKWERLLDLQPEFWLAAWETLYITAFTLVLGGAGGLLIGLGLVVTRSSGLLPNRFVHGVLNVVVNTVRPIPFVIFVVAVLPLTWIILGTGIGNAPAILAMSLAAMFAIGRIVEQNLITVPPGAIEAARAAGAGPLRIIGSVLLPEALGQLILGFTFVYVALVDMSAILGIIAAGGLGAFVLLYGHRDFNAAVTVSGLVVIILLVQAAQFFGNRLARRVLRR